MPGSTFPTEPNAMPFIWCIFYLLIWKREKPVFISGSHLSSDTCQWNSLRQVTDTLASLLCITQRGNTIYQRVSLMGFHWRLKMLWIMCLCAWWVQRFSKYWTIAPRCVCGGRGGGAVERGSWDELRPRTRNSTQVFQLGAWDPRTWSIVFCPQGFHEQKAGMGSEVSWDCIPGTPVCCGFPIQLQSYCTKTLLLYGSPFPSFPFFFFSLEILVNSVEWYCFRMSLSSKLRAYFYGEN